MSQVDRLRNILKQKSISYSDKERLVYELRSTAILAGTWPCECGHLPIDRHSRYEDEDGCVCRCMGHAYSPAPLETPDA